MKERAKIDPHQPLAPNRDPVESGLKFYLSGGWGREAESNGLRALPTKRLDESVTLKGS